MFNVEHHNICALLLSTLYIVQCIILRFHISGSCPQLANIIWGEAGEGDDHIVPYPGGNKHYCNKKERNQEAAATKLTGLQTLGAKRVFDDAKLESSSNIDKDGRISSEVSMDSWADLSSSNFTKNGREALTTELSNSNLETAKYDSTKGGENIESIDMGVLFRLLFFCWYF